MVLLSGLFLLQVLAALFFLSDVLGDFLGWSFMIGVLEHNHVELLVVSALFLGLVFTGVEVRRVLRRQLRVEAQLKAASGAFHELIEENFEVWKLTPSERDVALMAIKGLSIAEIAKVRNTREGTIKAQCNAIYAKAGVTGRTQLLSHFIEELMSERLV